MKIPYTDADSSPTTEEVQKFLVDMQELRKNIPKRKRKKIYLILRRIDGSVCTRIDLLIFITAKLLLY